MRIIKANLKNLKKITKSVKKGEVLIFPTDTVYGLICDATNERAVKKLFEIKKRSKEKAIPIFVKDIKMAKKLAYISKNQEKFLKRVWFTRPNFWEKSRKEKKLVKIAPKIWAGKGKVTVILKAKPKTKKIFPKRILSLENKIGLRIPDYKLVNILLKKLNSPLTGTSANISGKPASGNIKKILNQFKNKRYQPDLVIDAGNLPKSRPSTVLDLTSSPPKFLRI